MSLLAIGVSYRSAPVGVLERASAGTADAAAVVRELVRSEHVGEAMLLSTCNRVEAYVDVAKFHGGVYEVTAALARRAGADLAEFGEHLYVHYEQAAAEHLFRVTAGLDSMVVGESQILGQVRAAYAAAVEQETVGRTLHGLVQRALAAAKRVHAETAIDRDGASVMGRAVELAAAAGPLAGRRPLIVGAGSMGALGGTLLARAGMAPPVVANRSAVNATRLAAGLGGRAVGLDRLGAELATADLVLTATGSTTVLLDAATVARALPARAGRPLIVLDLALPRDADPAIGALDGVTYLDLAAVREATPAGDADAVAAAEALLAQDVQAYLAAARAIGVAPTVAALRARAADVVQAELSRLDAKLPGLDPRVRAELAGTLRRTVSTLLHGPTVRMKQLAAAPGGSVYTDALRTLFELGPDAAEAVSAAHSAEDCLLPPSAVEPTVPVRP